MIHRIALNVMHGAPTLATIALPRRRPAPGLVLAAAVAVALAVLCGVRLADAPDFSAGFAPARAPALTAGVADDYVRNPADAITHVASAVELPDGRLAAFWYEGTAEAVPDVRIRMAVSTGDGWGEPVDVADAATTAADQRRFIRFVGNPVAWRHPDGGYWLFYASSSIGGWSMVQLNVMRSEDGLRWGPSRRLVTAPFLNMTASVKATPLAMADGRIALPVYTEFLGMFPELLLVDADGTVVNKTRMGGGGREAIQPALAAVDGRHAVALLRNMSSRPFLWRTETFDGGASFSPLEQTAVPNPGSPAATVTLADGRVLTAGNFEGTGAALLSLAILDADGELAGIETLLDGRAEGRWYRYPYLLADSGGQLHLFVTEYFAGSTRRAIRHLTVDPARIPAPDAG